jgi:hypothetical protein
VPDKYLADFIRGALDGDGCLMTGTYNHSSGRRYQYNQCYLCGGSKAFIKSFEKILRKKNISCSYTERDPTTTTLKCGRKIRATAKQYKVSINKKSSLKQFLNWIYYPNNSLAMPRKAALADIILNNL